MMNNKRAFCSFAVNDIGEAKKFYSEVTGLEVETLPMGLKVELPGGGWLFVYPRENHQPALFTVLNFLVDDLDQAMEQLREKGVVFEHYSGLTDEDGVSRRGPQGPNVAWFKDPAGNILAVIEESGLQL